MSSYTLISSDSHIIEPADLWETRIDRKFQGRAPRLVHEGALDQWYADGVKFGNIGTNQQAGLRFEAPEKLTAGGSMNSAPQGGFDPHAHVKDMDLDSVAGGVLYPSQGLTVYRVPDSELLSAIFRATTIGWPTSASRTHIASKASPCSMWTTLTTPPRNCSAPPKSGWPEP